MQESQVNVVTALVADSQPSVAVKPGQRPLYHPAVSAQLLAALHSLTSYAAFDAPVAKRRSVPAIVICLVSMPLVRALAWTSSLTCWTRDRLDAVHHFLKHHRVRDVSTSQFHRKGYAFGFDHNMALRARFALICGVAPNSRGLWVPLFTPLAATVSLSRLALDQSILSASPNRLSSACVACATLQLVASRAVCARRLHHCHNPSPGVASPTVDHSSARR